MRNIVADVETDELLDKLTVVHSLVLRDLDSDSVISCADQEGFVPIRDGLAVLSNAEKVYWHNGIKFDFPAIEKVYGFEPHAREKMRDTFVIAGMRWAHIKDDDYKRAAAKQFPKQLAGSHALKAWGFRLGILKGDFKYNDDGALDHWTPELQEQCVQDTAVTKALVLKIRQAGVSNEAVEIEHALAWYLAAQERNGVPFDMEKAIALQAKLSARREEIAEKMRVEFGPLVKKDGKPVVPKKDNKKKGVVAGVEYQKIKIVDFNPGSRQHIAFKLTTLFGWKPSEFTESGQVKIDEKTLKGLNGDIPAVKLLSEYLLVEKRLGQLSEGKEGWLRHVTDKGPDGGVLTGLQHIHHRVKQNFAITHRASHANPNLAQVPKVGSPFGAECRELFYVPDGWQMIGADASSLEARCLAHYMAKYDDGAYGRLLLEGDVHTANRIALGLPEGKAERDKAKTFLYAFLYGGGGTKLGTILNPSLPENERKSLGESKKRLFLKNTPALARLIADVQKGAQKGWLRAIDGRRVYVRSDHSALNTLLQCAGSLIVKRWLVNAAARMEREHGPQGWQFNWASLLYIHDETEWAVRPEFVESARTILLEELTQLTEHFRWRVPLAGEAKVGRSWADVH